MAADPDTNAKRAAEYGSHTYDGIVENDNPLPSWWKWTLYGAIIFAVFYWFDVQMFKLHPTASKRYEVQAAAEAKAKAEEAITSGTMTGEVLVAMAHDPAAVARGRETFTSTCAACHRADGAGNIGPNLTDNAWMHGGKPMDVFRSVHDGWPLKGMPTWAPALGEKRVTEVAAYVLTLKNSNVPGGKAPQGDPED